MEKEIQKAKEKLKLVIEAALMASAEPLTVARIAGLFDIDEQHENDAIRDALHELQLECTSRAYELVEVSSGWRFQIRQSMAVWVNKLWEERPVKYSRATLETLALIAYRQPITRGDIEEVRGVAVSTHIIQSLLERNWVRIVGHRDVPGRPALYATTRQFLDYFNLKSLDQLPSLSEIRDIDHVNPELVFNDAASDRNSSDVLIDEEDDAASSMATLILPGG